MKRSAAFEYAEPPALAESVNKFAAERDRAIAERNADRMQYAKLVCRAVELGIL